MNVSKQNGFTLLEVLVAVLIFAIGLLGLAGLQLKAHQSSSYAHGRTVATLAASGLVERMRANLAGAVAGDYIYDSGVDGLPAAVPACNSGAGCGSSANMAQNDLREWLLGLDRSLPILNGSNMNSSTAVNVCIDGTPETAVPATAGTGFACDGDPDQWTIYIDWSDQRNLTSENQTVNRYTFTFVP